MRALLGPRFGVEATFIVVVAIVAGLLELPLTAILVAVFGSWLLVAIAEIVASRRTASRPALATEHGIVAPAPPAPISAPPEPEPAHIEPLTVEAEREPEAELPVAEAEAGETAVEAAADLDERPRLAAVPAPPPEPPAEPEPVPEPPAEPTVVEIHPSVPREWNVWDLQRRLEERAGGPAADEERSYLLMYLREYATADGALPLEFDALVRESFGDLVEAEQ